MPPGSESRATVDLATITHAAWDELIAACRPEEILALLETEMGERLRARTTVEDVWQDANLHAWRDRARHVWHGRRSFRRWLIQVARHRLLDAVDRELAAHCDPAREVVPTTGGADSTVSGALFVDTSTPSRAAVRRERVQAVHEALQAVPAEDREVVRLRFLAELGLEEVAAKLGIPLSTAKARLSRGAEVYERELTVRWHRHRVG